MTADGADVSGFGLTAAGGAPGAGSAAWSLARYGGDFRAGNLAPPLIEQQGQNEYKLSSQNPKNHLAEPTSLIPTRHFDEGDTWHEWIQSVHKTLSFAVHKGCQVPCK
jgi:hypothetical protein